MIVKKPPGICITASNWFNEGWLFGMLGLPPRTFNEPSQPVSEIDIDAWQDGYLMAMQSELLSTATCHKMRRTGQLTFEIRK